MNTFRLIIVTVLHCNSSYGFIRRGTGTSVMWCILYGKEDNTLMADAINWNCNQLLISVTCTSQVSPLSVHSTVTFTPPQGASVDSHRHKCLILLWCVPWSIMTSELSTDLQVSVEAGGYWGHAFTACSFHKWSEERKLASDCSSDS